VDAFAGDPNLFGFYIMDEPLPPTCPAANLLAEDDWIHAHVPARGRSPSWRTSQRRQPTFAGSYTHARPGWI